jgi:hypothetical protein
VPHEPRFDRPIRIAPKCPNANQHLASRDSSPSVPADNNPDHPKENSRYNHCRITPQLAASFSFVGLLTGARYALGFVFQY